jgi:glycerol-3-phosphate dehydrogenase
MCCGACWYFRTGGAGGRCDVITRDPDRAAAVEHDLVIVGGGIYGVSVALEAARRGLRPLLLERGDFGEATTWNSLRILHGGLRYLQTLDMRRFRDSVLERRWFCRTYPELVEPQECLMPLYGEGLKHPVVLRAALFGNDLLSWRRNAGVDPTRRLARGRLLSATETIARFPLVDRWGLRGAALWYDARMRNSQRVLIEMLHWACSLGATALNYVEATGLVRHGARIGAVLARDTLDGRRYAFPSSVVCNCAGPWSTEVGARFDGVTRDLFRPSLAFNLLIDCDPPCTSALAVAPRQFEKQTGPVLFLCPAFGRLLAGTVHLPWNDRCERPQPTEEQIEHFLSHLNAAVPGLKVRRERVLRVFAGLLPVTHAGTAALSVRPVIRDHGRDGGLDGLVSVSGVKFTTARLVAEQALAVLARHFGGRLVRGEAARPPLAIAPEIGDRAPRVFGAEETRILHEIVRDEAVMTIDDLLCRRTNWAIAERDVDALCRRVSDAIGWQRRQSSRSGIRAAEETALGASASRLN